VVLLQVEVSDALQAAEGAWDGTGQPVLADVKDGGLAEEANLVGQAALEVVAQEEDFDEVFGSPDGGGDWTGELVVGKSEVPCRGGAKGIGESARELIVVDENDIEIFEVKELGRYGAVETVEPEVQENQLRGLENFLWKLPLQLVVTQVQLEEIFVLGYLSWDGAGEVVGVRVEEGELWYPVQDPRQEQRCAVFPRQPSSVQVYSRNCSLLFRVWILCTSYPLEIARVATPPVTDVFVSVHRTSEAHQSFATSLQACLTRWGWWRWTHRRRGRGIRIGSAIVHDNMRCFFSQPSNHEGVKQ